MSAATPTGPHPVARLLAAVLAGRPPVPDGGWEQVGPWRAGLGAVVAVTGRALLVLPDGVALPDAPVPDGFGGAHDPRLVSALAGRDGWIDALDVLLGARGTGGPAVLVPRPDLGDHPRAARAAELRDDVLVLGLPDERRKAVVVLATGIGGLAELAVEVEPDRHGRGEGRRLLRAALASVPHGVPVVAAVAPGNAASLRALLATGFAPVGSVQLFRPV